MMGMILRITMAFLALAFLASCSSEKEETTSLPGLLLDTVKQSAAARRAGPPQRVIVTPKMLAETKTAALQINPELTGGSDFLRRAATRRDSNFGTVEIWNSSDNAQIFLRNGVVVGTRGVGSDIISADANVTVSALASRTNRNGLRSYVVSDGDMTTTDLQFRCDIRNVGPQIIVIVNQQFRTTHLQETCVGGIGGDMTLNNDYWVQSGSNLVRKSRQWVGPRSGYFETILLKN